MSLPTWFPPVGELIANNSVLSTPDPQNRPVIGTVWGYPGDSMDPGPTAWGDWLDLKSDKWRNVLGVSLPTEGAHAVPLSQVPFGGLVTIRSSQTGQSITVPRIDKGPAAWTGAGVDLTWNAARALGLDPKEGKFAGLYVNPTGQRITPAQLGDYVYTGAMRIEPGASDLMKEPGMSTPINFTSGGWTNNPFAPAGPGAAPVWQKTLATVGFGITLLVLVVSLLQDRTPIQIVKDGAKVAGSKIKTAATLAAG